MKSKYAPRILAALASISILCCASVRAQTLQFRYTFEDGPGTTTIDDPSSAIFPLTMNLLNAGSGAADLHGAAGSGVQGQGVALNLSTNPIAGNLGGAFALVQNSATLGSLGIVTDFTATVWINMPNLQTNMANQGSRIYNLVGTGMGDIGTNVNSLGFQPQYANTSTPLFPKFAMRAVIGTTFVNPAIYYDVPTNVWLFYAMTYNSVSGIASVYYGTEASPAKLYMSKNIGAGTNFNFSGTPSFSLGDRPGKGRSFPGLMDDARFYAGAGNAIFIENIRRSATPVVVANLSPDGSLLQSGTNVLSFTATSPNGINTAGIKVAVNGSNVTSGLTFTPTTGGQIVSYANMPINPTVLQQSNIDGVTVSIQIADNGGINTTNAYVYDAFCTTNFTWEAEDFDFNGQFIPNPVMSFVGPDTNTYFMEQTPYVSLVDVNDNGSANGPLRVYRDPTFPVETEYSVGGGGPTAGGHNLGELMRQKTLDAYNITNIAGEVNVGFFDGGTGPGLPNWMNYTRMFPTGDYNVYMRFADGGGTLTASLDQVTSGWGTTSQTITNLGTFNMVNSGGWDNFMWVPLRDSSGNLARVQLSGTNTIRLTAGNSGGGNVNFLMLTPANTNLPAINNVYPNGTNMFQPSPVLSFGAASPSGVAINTAAVKVRLTVTNLLGQGFVTNMTSTNGLTISGSPTNLLVTAPLITNSFYTASITIADVNGSAVGNSVTFDTLAPAYTWEAPDYDYGGSLFVPDPIAVDGYMNLSGISGVDFNYPNNPAPPFNNYRDGSIVGVEGGTTDFPLRLQYLTNSPVPAAYDLGYYNGGNWVNYTRVFPSGLYNIFVRAADGSAALGNVGISQVTDGWGTSVQTTTNLGSFNIPATGGWQTYTWAPLRDSSGNLVKFNGGGTTNTLRATSAGSQNVFFYALFPANTNLPILSGVSPVSGTKLTNTFSFGVQSVAGVSSNNVVVTVNGITVSNLVFTGTINNWAVRYPHLSPNTVYAITVTVTDVNGNVSTTSATFDTINPNNYTWEAEDFDHDGGLFIDNPQTNAYVGLQAITNGVDTFQVNFAGTDTYRPNGMDTAANGDVVRPQYQDVNNPQTDYTMGFFSDGAWANYTRHYPAGSYNIFGRFATASTSGLGTDALLAQVTSGWGTTLQTSNVLGSFTIPNTGGWETYTYVPLRDNSGNMVTVTFNGSTNTLTLIRPVDVPASADLNANYLMLVPVLTANAAQSGTNLVITFPTLGGFNYQVQYKTNLLDPTWAPLGSPIPGNNGNKSVSDPDNNKGTRFYRVQIQ